MDLKIREFEINILKNLRGISNTFFDNLLQIITFLGEQYVLIGIIAIIYFLYDKEIGRKVAFALFTSLLINNSLKGIVKYPRPFAYDPSLEAVRVETATGFSFPSGHTQLATTLYSSIALHGNLHEKTKLSKKLIWFIAILIFSLVGFSRIYLAVHYPKDVIFGIILGLASVFISSYLFKLFKNTLKNEMLVYIAILFIFLPFITIFYDTNFIYIEPYRDFYKAYALFLGFVLATLIDKKYINFTCNTTLKKKLLRLLGAGICLAFIQFGLKLVFPENKIFFDFLRYFLITFVSLGIYPLLFRKNLFRD